MRVTGNRMIDVAALSTSTNQSKVSEAADQVTSGLRVAKPSDDPIAYMAAQRASARMKLSEGAGTALKAGKERLDLTDGSLAGIGDALSRMQEMATQGANDTYSAEDRKGMAVAVRAMFAAALGSANAQAADGEYILAGSSSTTAPFDAAGAYTGNAMVRSLATTENDTAGSTVAGSALTSASGVDVLPLFNRLALALDADDTNAITGLLGDIDTAVKQTALARTKTGSAMSVMTSALSAHADLDNHLTNTISDAIEADVIAAASNLAKASTALEASKTVTSHIISIVNPNQ